MRRARLPLDKDACAKANAAVSGECQSALSMRPEHASLRAKWMDSYVAAGGEVEQDVQRGDSGLSPVCPCQAAQEPAPCSVSPPASLTVGTADYYRRRCEDFTRRHGGPPPEPPHYYMEYGDKYRAKFAALDGGDLSPEGLAWRDCTLRKLQQMIEDRCAADPCGFADVELDDAAFKRLAFDTHPAAYTDCGLLQLPLGDLVKIGRTPDLSDSLLDWDGLSQVAEVLKKMKPSDAKDIADATLEKIGQTVAKWFE